MFKDDDRNDVNLHMVKFHMHTHNLKVEFLEYCLLNMFMASLEGKARSCYEGLPPTSIFSLALT